MKPMLGSVVWKTWAAAAARWGLPRSPAPGRLHPAPGRVDPHVTEAILKTRPLYDPAKMEPISNIAVSAFAIAVHPSVPAQTLKELMGYPANPGRLFLRLTRCWHAARLTAELLEWLAQTPDITHVPYRGAARGSPTSSADRLDTSSLTGQMLELLGSWHRSETSFWPVTSG